MNVCVSIPDSDQRGMAIRNTYAEVEEGQEFFGPKFKSGLFGLLRLVET